MIKGNATLIIESSANTVINAAILKAPLKTHLKKFIYRIIYTRKSNKNEFSFTFQSSIFQQCR